MVFVMMAFVIALELRLIFAGQLGESEIAATAALVNITYMIQILAMAVQISAVSMIGNLIGENKPDLAWRLYRVNLLPWILFFAILCGLMAFFPEQLAHALSGESQAAKIEEQVMWAASVFAFMTSLNRLLLSPLFAVKK